MEQSYLPFDDVPFPDLEFGLEESPTPELERTNKLIGRDQWQKAMEHWRRRAGDECPF